MFRSKKVKAFLVALPLSVLFLTHPVYAATYNVAKGDSIYKIGITFNTNVSKIKADNSLSSDTIYPGQILYVQCGTYTVKSGDTLYLIAQKYGLSVYSVRAANNQWNDSIYAGQVLNLPVNNQNKQTSSSTVTYNSGDLDLLARLITAEADGEPYKAKVGVGAVVMNRVKDQRFPNSIGGVIYQKDSNYYQFTPVENGWINRPASKDAKNAAYDAIHGSDPTNGALYYFDDSTTNKWIWSKPIACRIDNMVYTY